MFVSTFGGISYYYLHVKDIVAGQANDFIMAVAEARANHIRTLLDEQIEKVKLVAENALIEEYLEEGLSPEEEQSLQSELREHLDREIIGVSIANLEGIVLMASDERFIGRDLVLGEIEWEGDRAEDLVERIRKERLFEEELQILFRSVYHDDLLGANLFEIGTYVMSDETDEPIGIVEIDFDSGILDGITLDRKGLGESGEIYLINHQGYTITPRIFKTQADLTELVDTPNSAECLEDLEENTPEVEEKDKREGKDLRVFTDEHGESRIGVDVPIYGVGWCLLSEYKERELYGLLNLKLLNIALLVLIFVTIATGVFTFVIDKLFLAESKP